jgi:Rrf2 family protein
MWITRESGLGLLALTVLAREGRASAEHIAEEYGLSAPFLRQILGQARRAGLVESRPGRSGGYMLTRPPREISVAQALEAFGGKPSPVACLAGVDCPLADGCPTRPLWEWLEERIAKWLSELSLEDLAKDRL